MKSCINCRYGIFPMPTHCRGCGFIKNTSSNPIKWRPEIKPLGRKKKKALKKKEGGKIK